MVPSLMFSQLVFRVLLNKALFSTVSCNITLPKVCCPDRSNLDNV